MDGSVYILKVSLRIDKTNHTGISWVVFGQYPMVNLVVGVTTKRDFEKENRSKEYVKEFY